MSLKCPKCGNEKEFIASIIETHDCVIDEFGNWIEDLGCYQSSNVFGIKCSSCKFNKDLDYQLR